jgi:hypothetical protein
MSGKESDDLYLYSPACKAVADVTVSVGASLTLDGFQRLIYERINHNVQQQANRLLLRGNITAQEAAALVGARNELLLNIRKQLSPFGQLYSELLKPRSTLKDFDQFLRQKGTIEAVVSSVGKTRQIVDRIAVFSRVAGPATIVLTVVTTAVVIATASEAERVGVATREISGTVGSVAFGAGGMWAGCASAAALVSPSLILPVIGEVTVGGACFVGGFIGGLGLGYIGHQVGSSIGTRLYTAVSEFRWSHA